MKTMTLDDLSKNPLTENDIYKVSVKKTTVSLRIDNDVLSALKAIGIRPVA